MKAFKDEKGRSRLFRPNLNATRLRRSSLRAGLPVKHIICYFIDYFLSQDFDGKEFVKCLKEFVKIEQDWIPQKYGYSLYLRPTAISMTVLIKPAL